MRTMHTPPVHTCAPCASRHQATPRLAPASATPPTPHPTSRLPAPPPLQANFLTYLEERGVTGELGEYLRFLIYDKEQREYQAWLDETHDFVAK